jgi:outer membrane receptor protein involved in Fe transport
MLTAYVRRSQAERFNVNQAPDPDVRGFTSNLTVGTNADWRWAMPIGASALALRSGVDAAVNRVTVRIFNEASDGAPGDEEPDAASGLTTHVRSPSLDLASYAIADWRFGRVTVSAAGRYDFVRVPFENRIVSADRTTNDYRHFSPRAGVSVDVASGLTAYASVGRSFRAPAILELGCADPDAACPLPFALGEDPPLQPVRATTYEAGGRWTAGRATLSASAYRTNVRDEIVFVASPRALLSGYFTNLPKTRREGVEVAAQTSLWNDRLSAYANYAWTHATFRTPAQLFSIRSDDEFESSALAGANDVEAGDALPLVPAHQAKAGAVAHLGGGVTLGANARYIGRQWLRGDEANETSPLSPYTAADVRASYAVRGWEVTTIITNLFDSHSATFGTFNENRQTGALERFLTPLNARTLKITLTRRFGRA